MKKLLFIIVIALYLSGCAVTIVSTINKYEAVANQVDLGDSKEKVLSILLPTQEGLPSSFSKRPEKYMDNGNLVEIYFFRSAWQSDGLTTDDEFTPYVFKDGKLVAIGWTSIGGIKSQGQASPARNTSPTSSERRRQQILNHGAGGCTPNFATGGCL